MADKVLFEVDTPLGFRVRCTRRYWQFISGQKHPAMAGRHREVIITLRDPDEVRRSRKDEAVLLFYRGEKPRWICAVTKRENGEGFLITAYPSDSVKAGERVWKKSR